jgi:hypothetical protein
MNVTAVSARALPTNVVPDPIVMVVPQFDCTGQQLIDAGFVLINGERVSLNLQAAETGFQARP